MALSGLTIDASGRTRGHGEPELCCLQVAADASVFAMPPETEAGHANIRFRDNVLAKSEGRAGWCPADVLVVQRMCGSDAVAPPRLPPRCISEINIEALITFLKFISAASKTAFRLFIT